jgi:hypothetical protein
MIHSFESVLLSFLKIILLAHSRLVLVAHTCNLSYLGGRDQEDSSLKPAQSNSSQDPISKKPFTKIGWWGRSRSRL